jgi:hypothetical protein
MLCCLECPARYFLLKGENDNVIVVHLSSYKIVTRRMKRAKQAQEIAVRVVH